MFLSLEMHERLFEQARELEREVELP